MIGSPSKPANAKQIKKSGSKVPNNEPVESLQNLESEGTGTFNCKEKMTTKIVILIAVVLVLAATIILIVAALSINRQIVEVVIVNGPKMRGHLNSGGTFVSESLEVKDQGKSLDLTINSVDLGKKLLQEQSGTPSKSINHYHKDTQISVSFDNFLNVQIKIPGDTGLGYILGDAPASSESTLQKLPDELPKVLISEIQKVTGKKVVITTQVSYDGVYDNKTGSYTILNQKRSYHPDEFAKITPSEKDLIGPKPIVNNFNDIKEITTKIAESISTLANNVKNAILANKDKLFTFTGAIESKTTAPSTTNSITKTWQQVKSCTKMGDDLLRCSKEAWGALKVSNPNDPDPLQIWEIVVRNE